ncbi:MAG TPA: hypothetical protein VNK52_03525 [Hyphomicrobiaceae bacterium]|nr:hypothetical protein [Hyphomicrobiaceae bacterium]
MSLNALPLLVIVFILYNLLVVFGGADANTFLAKEVVPIPLMTTTLMLSWADLLILLTMVLLFVELMKATYTSTSSLLNHGLSTLVFVVCLIELLMVPQAATPVFFLVTVATLIEVVASYTIGIRVARRDLSLGGEG